MVLQLTGQPGYLSKRPIGLQEVPSLLPHRRADGRFHPGALAAAILRTLEGSTPSALNALII
jgi:hypothetical protein